jgi:hypothetical protein
VDIGLKGLRTPPRDLEATLAQQTLLLAAAREAWTHVEAHASDATRVGVLIGCQCDAEVARYGARWRLAEWGAQLGWSAERVRAAQDSVTPVLEAAGVLGTMPNIPANRLSGQLDARGPGFAISAEELSGVRALEVGARMLRAGELDVALVGAVDLSCEPVHEAALASVTGTTQSAGDAAVVCVLMRASSARAAGLPCIALIDTSPLDHAELASAMAGAASLFGHAHAAVGLLDVVVAALRARTSQQPATLRLDGLLGATSVVRVLPGDAPTGLAGVLAAPPSAGPALTLPAHLPSIPRLLPDTAAPARAKDHSMQTMPPAPSLPSVGAKPSASAALAPTVSAVPVRATAPVAASVAVDVPAVVTAPAAPVPANSTPSAGLAPHDFALFAAHPQHVAAVHQQFVAQQAALHQQFLALRQHALVGLVQARSSAPAINAPLSFAAPAPHQPPAAESAPAPHASSAAPVATPPRPAPLASTAPTPASAASQAPVASSPSAASVAARPAAPQPAPASIATPARAAAATVAPSQTSLLRKPTGPSFDRAALEVHAGGTISQIFGPLFAQQDVHSVQVRMPEPPLLLADRVTGIAAEAGSMKKGTVWTETDVREDSWWLNQGYMPAGIMIESGQADLFLISYLGVDFLNRGERAYRLLGCELTYHGSLPKPGETLVYEIDVDGHANQGDVRLFFFHYDCVLRDAAGPRASGAQRASGSGRLLHDQGARRLGRHLCGSPRTRRSSRASTPAWMRRPSRASAPRSAKRPDPCLQRGQRLRLCSVRATSACSRTTARPRSRRPPCSSWTRSPRSTRRAAPGSAATCAPRRPSRPTTGSSRATSRTTRACRAPSCSRAACR